MVQQKNGMIIRLWSILLRSNQGAPNRYGKMFEIQNIILSKSINFH